MTQGHVFDAGDEVRLQVLNRPHKVKFLHLSENRVEHQAEFEPRKVSAQVQKCSPLPNAICSFGRHF